MGRRVSSASARLCGDATALVALVVLGLGATPQSAYAAARHDRSAYRLAQAYNFAPTSRTVLPAAVLKTTGRVKRPAAVLHGHATRLSGHGAMVILDFGREVGGLASITFASASDAHQTVGIAFAESSKYAGPVSDNSMGGKTDGYVTVPVSRGTYTLPKQFVRGGFRYLTVFLTTTGWVDLRRVSLHFTPAPDLGARPNAYPDYFRSSDPLLNRIWYAGAYTVEMDTSPHDEARVAVLTNLVDPTTTTWDDSADVGVPGSVILDGAKRDRAIWPGDLLMSVPADLASLDDLAAVGHTLDALYIHQSSSGALPYAGPPINLPGEAADPYHLDALIATADFVTASDNTAWLESHWSQYQRAVVYAIGKTEPATGLFNVSGPSDWARADQGGVNLEANDLMYEVLKTCVTLAGVEQDSTLAGLCASRATQLKSNLNTALWDPSAGAYKDDPTGSLNPPTALYPQDGNALAIWFGLTQSAAQDASILAYLRKDWTPIGARTPEWLGGKGIHPFPGGMEVMARFTAGDNIGALDLIRREWGWMLASRYGTRSTFWEGYWATGDFSNYYNGGFTPDYTSLAHGWSAGPTVALSAFVLGIGPDVPGGARYHATPHTGDLAWAEGRLTMPAGAATVSWRRPRHGFALKVTDPGPASRGEIAVPLLGAARAITVNGTPAWDGHRFLGASGITGASQQGDYVVFHGVGPGRRKFGWGTER